MTHAQRENVCDRRRGKLDGKVVVRQLRYACGGLSHAIGAPVRAASARR